MGEEREGKRREKKRREREREGERKVEGEREEEREEGEGREEARCYHWHTSLNSHTSACVRVYLEVVEVQCTVKGEDANHSPGISW